MTKRTVDAFFYWYPFAIQCEYNSNLESYTYIHNVLANKWEIKSQYPKNTNQYNLMEVMRNEHVQNVSKTVSNKYIE